MIRWLVALIPALLIGCTVARAPLPPINPAELEWSKKPGTSTVQGQLFARTGGGDVKFCAGLDVTLVPVSPYVDAVMRELSESRKPEPPPLEIRSFVRTTVGDGFGNFEFKNVPAGQWYAYCTIEWILPYSSAWQIFRETAHAGVRFKIADGETKKVVGTPDTLR